MRRLRTYIATEGKQWDDLSVCNVITCSMYGEMLLMRLHSVSKSYTFLCKHIPPAHDLPDECYSITSKSLFTSDDNFLVISGNRLIYKKGSFCIFFSDLQM